MTDETKWPAGFGDIGCRTFAWVRANRPEWVEFTLSEMSTPSGLFLLWKKYLLSQKVKEHDAKDKTDPTGTHG